jgi:hypothetical protein
MVEDRLRLAVKFFKTSSKFLFCVITTLSEWLTRNIVDASFLGRIEENVIRTTTRSVYQTPSNPLDQKFIVDLEVDDLNEIEHI